MTELALQVAPKSEPQDGWGSVEVSTGDLGVRAPDGKVRVTGRADHCFKLACGTEVSPTHIEDALIAANLIRQVCLALLLRLCELFCDAWLDAISRAEVCSFCLVPLLCVPSVPLTCGVVAVVVSACAQAVVCGEGKPCSVALVVPDYEKLQEAQKKRLGHEREQTEKQLLDDPRLKAMVDAEVEQVAAEPRRHQ